MGWPEYTAVALMAGGIAAPAVIGAWRETAINSVSAALFGALLYAGGFFN